MMNWFVSLSVVSFWIGVVLYPVCLILLGYVLFYSENSGGYTGNNQSLLFGGYLMIAAADGALSYIYSSMA